MFDDTYDHEVWNEASGTRIVLRIRFDRPLRNPGKWVADRVRRLPGLRAADEAARYSPYCRPYSRPATRTPEAGVTMNEGPTDRPTRSQPSRLSVIPIRRTAISLGNSIAAAAFMPAADVAF